MHYTLVLIQKKDRDACGYGVSTSYRHCSTYCMQEMQMQSISNKLH